jgi:hypothetical protein
MQTFFKTIRLKAGANWTVVLTTPEGADHEIDGFQTVAHAQAWIARETGQSVSEVSPMTSVPSPHQSDKAA